MKLSLKTLLEYKRYFDLLRAAAERDNIHISTNDFLAALDAAGAFDRELARIIEQQEVEVTQ